MIKTRIYGYSLHINLTECLHNEIFFNSGSRGKILLKIFIEYILNLIDMKPVFEPLVEYYGDFEENEGYSYVQLINTSNITIHTVSSTRDVYIDLFSCREFDKDKIVSYSKFYFEPKTIDYDYLYR